MGAQTVWRMANQRGEQQIKLFALSRTLIGLLAFYFFIWTSVIAAMIVTVRPGLANVCLNVADTTLSGLWTGMPGWFRYFLPVMSGTVLYCWPSCPILAFLGHVIAAKLAGELLIQNHKKEQKLARME